MAGAALLLAGSPAGAQDRSGIDVRGEVFVGSDVERYLRDLQVAGAAPLYPWSVRGFGPGELVHAAPTDSSHPWAGRYRLHPDTAAAFQLRLVRPRAQIFYNSAFPYGVNDGPVWAGRGVTTAVQAGVSAAWGPLSLTVAPMAFVAENAEFELMDHGVETVNPYADGSFPTFIDLPQRFGDERYAVLDPGQSTLRLDVRGLAAGVSTANQHWGPATDSPLLLGNNAAGFPHVFVGTSRPADLWIGRLHGKLVVGSLRQSAWSDVQDHPRRVLAGAVATFSPRGVPGLELGGGRLFHGVWPEGGLGASAILLPLQGFLKVRLPNSLGDVSDPENQLASAFFRWVHPRAGVELWGEFAREDHSYDLRDLLLQPDHNSAFLLGVRRVWTAPGGNLASLRLEFVNARVTHLREVRQQGPAFYVHTNVRQGHTHRGQLLGSAAGFGGLGTVLALDRYDRSGRWSVHLDRTLHERGGAEPSAARSLSVASSAQSVGLERLFFLGGFEIGSRAIATYEINRHFSDDDVFNLNLGLQVTRGF